MRNNKKTLLSFEVDEDEVEEIFEVKKSKSSQKYKKMKQAPNLFPNILPIIIYKTQRRRNLSFRMLN